MSIHLHQDDSSPSTIGIGAHLQTGGKPFIANSSEVFKEVFSGSVNPLASLKVAYEEKHLTSTWSIDPANGKSQLHQANSNNTITILHNTTNEAVVVDVLLLHSGSSGFNITSLKMDNNSSIHVSGNSHDDIYAGLLKDLDGKINDPNYTGSYPYTYPYLMYPAQSGYYVYPSIDVDGGSVTGVSTKDALNANITNVVYMQIMMSAANSPSPVKTRLNILKVA